MHSFIEEPICRIGSMVFPEKAAIQKFFLNYSVQPCSFEQLMQYG